MLYKKTLTKEQALQKLRHYCAYQERCHSEVRQKLFQLGLSAKDHDELIADLITEGYLNEERFAIAFAGGKFRMKNWGKVRIEMELRKRMVSDYSIKKALREIDDEDYQKTLMKIASAKYLSCENEEMLSRKKKTIDYCLHKGYESELVRGVVDQFTK